LSCDLTVKVLCMFEPQLMIVMPQKAPPPFLSQTYFISW